MSDPDYDYMCFRLASVHSNWRYKMGYRNRQPTDDELKQKIRDLDQSDPQLKASLIAEAVDWCARDDAACAKYRPVPPPAPTGRYTYRDSFVALSLGRCRGVIKQGLDQALDSGDTVVVPIEVVDSHVNWLFFIDAIDVAWGGKDIDAFLSEVSAGGTAQQVAEILYHRVIYNPPPAFLRYASCRVTAQCNGTNNRSPRESVQYGAPQDTLDGAV
ncbi:hypothetical protein ABZ894_02665 [Nocardia beijingensis]|uniref:hypothetical protein n=1 Tax=Nocardia beijingensis TaxID=95162 RepID=UPI0033D4ADA6